MIYNAEGKLLKCRHYLKSLGKSFVINLSDVSVMKQNKPEGTFITMKNGRNYIICHNLHEILEELNAASSNNSSAAS